MPKTTSPTTAIQTDISAGASFTSEGRNAWPKLPDRHKLQAACPQQFRDLAADLLKDYDKSKAYLEANPLEELAGHLRNTHGLEAVELHNKINAIDRDLYNQHVGQLRDTTQLLIQLSAQIFKACEGPIHDDLVAEVAEVEARCARLGIPVSHQKYQNGEIVTVYFAWRDPALSRLHQARHALSYFAERATSQPRVYSDGQFCEAVRYCATTADTIDPM